MPKQTFFNLPEEKREIILKAARQEFSRVLLNEASISNIIKIADIPRGSFYQYFEDKDDLFLFLVEELGKSSIQSFLDSLETTQGDLLKACEQLFRVFINVINQEENRQFNKNIMLSMNEKMKECAMPHPKHHAFTKHYKDMIDKIDTSILAIKSKEEMIYLLKMIKCLIFQNVSQFINGRISQEECLKEYDFQLNLIKKAIYKVKQ